MSTCMKTKTLRAVILTANEFEDMELFFPYFRLTEEGVQVDIAAPKKGNIRGENGYVLKIVKTFDEINPNKLTSFWGDGLPEELKQSGANYVGEEVVVDGNLVTSRYPFDLPSFMREVVSLVKKIKKR